MPAAAVAVLALAGLGIAQTHVGRQALDHVGIAPPDEPYTELYFTRPSHLPDAPAGGSVRFSFTVHDMEGGPRTYRWTATTHEPGAPPVAAASGVVALADGRKATVRARVPLTCAGRRQRVDVSTGGPHESIGFWVPCGDARP